MSITDLKSNHIGKKIERIREIKGMKQETLATKIGVSQQTISRIEQSEVVEDEKLNQIAAALEVSVETIKHFNEDAAINNINNFHDNSTVNTIINTQFNPVEKIVELYERLLKEKDQVIEMFKTQQKAS